MRLYNTCFRALCNFFRAIRSPPPQVQRCPYAYARSCRSPDFHALLIGATISANLAIVPYSLITALPVFCLATLIWSTSTRPTVLSARPPCSFPVRRNRHCGWLLINCSVVLLTSRWWSSLLWATRNKNFWVGGGRGVVSFLGHFSSQSRRFRQ